MNLSKIYSSINVSPFVLAIKAGEEVENTCEKAVQISNRDNVTVVFNHNGAEVHVAPGTTKKEALDFWHKTMGDRSIAYKNSPEGIKAAFEQEEYKQKRHEERKAGKLFSIREVLTQTTGLFFIDFSKGESHQDLFDFVYPENAKCNGLLEGCELVKEIILKQYPQLKEIDSEYFSRTLGCLTDKKAREDFCKNFLKEQTKKYGANFLIKGA